MANQTAGNVLVALRREATINVQATATGATQMRILDSTGFELKRAPIKSQERRSDLLTSMGRLGYKSIDASYNTELTVGGHHDLLMESIFRSVYATATSFAFSSVTTVAIGTSTLTPGTGSSFITAGVRVGDVFYLSSTTVSGDNSINAQVVAVSATGISVPLATFTTLAASATGTLTILKKVQTPSSKTDYSYTIEQYDGDIDVSQLATGNRVVAAKYTLRPGQPVTVEYTFMGCDRTALASGASPYFTSPSLTTSLALAPDVDLSLRVNSTLVTTFTGLDITYAINAAGQGVLGSTTTADIFANDLDVTGSCTGLRADFAFDTLYDAETEFEMFVKLEEPNTGPPKSIHHLYFPRVKVGALRAPVGGGDGPKVETRELWFGPKTAVAATGYVAGIGSISSSA